MSLLHRGVSCALAGVLLFACKKTAPSSSSADAAPAAALASATPDPASSGSYAGRDGGPHIGMMGMQNLDGGAPRLPPHVTDGGTSAPLPLASDALEVVAIGKTWSSKILWLQEIGSRVWLSGRNLDAYADGDGPLTKGPDLLAKFPYRPGVHSMRVVGAYPNLFALRTKNVNARMESPE